jgi:hypothetical protein
MNRFILMRTLPFLVLNLITPLTASSAHLYLEKDYQSAWCNSQNGKSEVVLKDKSRLDCLTETHAVEVEFAPKWKEAVGQALYYAIMTGGKPGIVLILEKPSTESKYLQRLKVVADAYGIDVWEPPLGFMKRI